MPEIEEIIDCQLPCAAVFTCVLRSLCMWSFLSFLSDNRGLKPHLSVSNLCVICIFCHARNNTRNVVISANRLSPQKKYGTRHVVLHDNTVRYTSSGFILLYGGGLLIISCMVASMTTTPNSLYDNLRCSSLNCARRWPSVENRSDKDLRSTEIFRSYPSIE